MNFWSNLSPLLFLISFSIGMFVLMLKDPMINVVVKYPTPKNLDTVYTSKTGDCYKYDMNYVSCNSGSKPEKIMEFSSNKVGT